MNAIIIDDELNARQTLRGLLALVAPQVVVLADAKDTLEGKNLIDQLKPDLVFLDINMPGQSGIDFIESFGRINFQLIFVTAYEAYAVKAFRLNAIDFLLKPVDPDELQAAIAKISKTPLLQSEQLKGLRASMLPQKQVDRIALSTAEGIHFVLLENIVRLESLGSYTRFHIAGQAPVVISRILKEYEELLEGHGFIRVHQSNVVNMKHVKKYVRGEGGQLWMTDGSEIEVSRRKKEEVVDSLKSMAL